MRHTLLLFPVSAGLGMAALQEPLRIEGGQITGTPTIQWTHGVRLYRALPYAAPPAGGLRWRPPQRAAAWHWGGRTAQSWGAYHGSEIVYVFNAFPLQDWAWRPVDLKLGDTVSSIWANFVKTGSPNGAGLPEWPAYDLKSDMLMNFGDSPKAQAAPAREALDFIAEWTASQRK